jgi:Histidine phosphatase superfamily (branch 2)
MADSSSADFIPLNQLSYSRPSDSLDIEEQERDTLLTHYAPFKTRTARGAIWQIITFTVIGLIVAIASGIFALTLPVRPRIQNSGIDYIHVDLPDLDTPTNLRYFGGMGPWIGGEYTPPPSECKVTQVHMISRHGERYPTRGMGSVIAQFARNISNHKFQRQLACLNDWDLTTDDWLYSPEDQLEQETLTGPAAGSLRMFTMGTEFRARYGDVWNFTDHSPIKLWASDSTRVIDSANYFALGFFGADTDTTVEVIPETGDRWGDSLTTTYILFSLC